MSWDDSTQTKRASVVAWSSGSAGTYDATVVIPVDFEEFWGSVQDDGFDVRFWSAEGTSLAYNRTTWTYSTRSASFRVAGIVTSAANEARQFFLYWGVDTTDGSTSPATGSGPLTCQITYARPPGITIAAQAPVVGATAPAKKFGKASAETVLVWWDVAALLLARNEQYHSSSAYEEISRVTDVVVTTNGTTQSSMTTKSATQIEDGRYIVTKHSGGTSGTKYTITVTFTTSLGRTLDVRAQMNVQDLSEA